MQKRTVPAPLPAPPPSLGPGLRRFLYFTAGLTGAAVLIVEILGAKMLSPYVGTSHFVWTAQIAVTLFSLASGYYFGGWLVDRSARLERLYLCILAAAVYLAFTVLACESVAYTFLSLNLALGALLSSAALFFVPLTLLAAVGPFLTRALAFSFQSLGKHIGRLSAISTLGSVFGTGLIGYVLIPFFPNSVTMFTTSGLLLALVAVYFAVWGRKSGRGGLVGVGIALAVGVGALGVRAGWSRQPATMTELYRGNSNFGLIQVIETKSGSRRYYLNDFLVQNTYEPASRKSLSMFTYMLYYLARGYATNPKSALCIGLGVGIAPMQLAKAGLQVDVVEINPAIVPVARDFFGLEPEKLNITIGDGRYFVNSSKKRYDAIVLDAFLGDSSPSHLMTREAFASMRRAMSKNGVLVINSFGDFQPGKDFFLSSLDKTLKSVFRRVIIHASGNGNVFFVASDKADLKLAPGELDPAIPGPVLEQVERALGETTQAQSGSGKVLTDDFNPVDFFDARNRESHRRTLALSVRDL